MSKQLIFIGILLVGIIAVSCETVDSKAVVIDGVGDTGYAPAFAFDGETLAGTWFRNGSRTMVLGVSHDLGATWTKHTLDTPVEMSIVMSNRAIISANRLYSCFYEQRSKAIWLVEVNLQSLEYRYIKIMDSGGKTFNSLAFTLSGITVHIACGFDYKLHYARLPLEGADTTPISVLVDDASVSKGALDAAIAVAGNDVYVAYWGSYTGIQKGTTLRLALSHDSGKSWAASDIQNLSDPSCSSGRQPSLYAAQGELWILYLSKTDIRLQYWDGTTWKKTTIAEKSEKPFSHPLILSENGNLMFAWLQDGWLFVSTISGSMKPLVRVDPAQSMRPDRSCFVVISSENTILCFQCETRAKQLIMRTFQY